MARWIRPNFVVLSQRQNKTHVVIDEQYGNATRRYSGNDLREVFYLMPREARCRLVKQDDARLADEEDGAETDAVVVPRNVTVAEALVALAGRVNDHEALSGPSGRRFSHSRARASASANASFPMPSRPRSSRA